MANIAIQIKVGKHPSRYEKGFEYHCSIGDENSKISNDELIKLVADAIEIRLSEKYGKVSKAR